MKSALAVLILLLFALFISVIYLRPGPFHSGKKLSPDLVIRIFVQNGIKMQNVSTSDEVPWLTNAPGCWEGKTLLAQCQNQDAVYCSFEHLGAYPKEWTKTSRQNKREHSEDTAAIDLTCYFSGKDSTMYRKSIKDLRAKSGRGKWAGWLE